MVKKQKIKTKVSCNYTANCYITTCNQNTHISPYGKSVNNIYMFIIMHVLHTYCYKAVMPSCRNLLQLTVNHYFFATS